MANRWIGVFLLAAQSILCSGAVVSQANLRTQSDLHSQPSPLTFSANIWNNTMTRFMQNEIELTKAKPPQVDKVLYVMFAMMFGCCGCDRCFMGQIMLGCVKGFTMGGFMVWYIIDYFVAVYSALASHKEIDMMGYHATFKPSSLEPAFWVAVVLLVLNVIQQFRTHQQVQMQTQQQEQLNNQMNAAITAMNASQKASATSEPVEKQLDIPMRHQSLALIPTLFTKTLRKAGLVTEKPTIPELIAAFEKMDKDGDGQLDPEEVKEGLAAMGASEDDVNEMIKTADTDGDGKISKDEFLAAVAKEGKKDAESK